MFVKKGIWHHKTFIPITKRQAKPSQNDKSTSRILKFTVTLQSAETVSSRRMRFWNRVRKTYFEQASLFDRYTNLLWIRLKNFPALWQQITSETQDHLASFLSQSWQHRSFHIRMTCSLTWIKELPRKLLRISLSISRSLDRP